jgi:hypothetical protein
MKPFKKTIKLYSKNETKNKTKRYFGDITETGHTWHTHMHVYDHHRGSNQKVWVNLMSIGWHLQCLLTVQ